MSRKTIVVLSVVISLVILFGVFASARAASGQRASLGAYVLSGSLINPLQPQVSQAKPSAPMLKQALPSYDQRNGGGHGDCESESAVNPEE